MKCPRTNTPLKPVKVGSMTIDLSEGCGGIWLDNFELNKLVSPSSFPGEVLVEHLKQFHNPMVGDSARLTCPKHTDVVLMRRYYSAKRQIEIDECPLCGGIWLDAEEFEAIRNLFPTKKDYEETQKSFVNEVVSGPEYKKHGDEQKQFVEKLSKISDILSSMVTGW